MPVCRKPMSGTALTTVSPSMVRIRRSTPCVLGCCGPILIVMVSTRCPSAPTVLSSIVYCVSISCCCILYCLVVLPGRGQAPPLPYASRVANLVVQGRGGACPRPGSHVTHFFLVL